MEGRWRNKNPVKSLNKCANRRPFLFLLIPFRCRAKAWCLEGRLSCFWLLPVGRAGPAKALISKTPEHPSSS